MMHMASPTPRSSNLFGVVGSLALHALCAACLLWSSRMPVALPMPPAPLQLLAPPHGGEERLLEAKDGAPECALGKVYVGIGVQYSLEGVVLVAPQSYPAFQAGIRLGDVLSDTGMKPDPEGYFTVDFTRRGQAHRVRIKTKRICLR
jgi:hypothetical protein